MTAKIAATTSRTNQSVRSPEACAVEWTLLTQSGDTEYVDGGNHDGERAGVGGQLDKPASSELGEGTSISLYPRTEPYNGERGMQVQTLLGTSARATSSHREHSSQLMRVLLY